jgi:hypothetical protein
MYKDATTTSSPIEIPREDFGACAGSVPADVWIPPGAMVEVLQVRPDREGREFWNVQYARFRGWIEKTAEPNIVPEAFKDWCKVACIGGLKARAEPGGSGLASPLEFYKQGSVFKVADACSRNEEGVDVHYYRPVDKMGWLRKAPGMTSLEFGRSAIGVKDVAVQERLPSLWGILVGDDSWYMNLRGMYPNQTGLFGLHVMAFVVDQMDSDGYSSAALLEFVLRSATIDCLVGRYSYLLQGILDGKTTLEDEFSSSMIERARRLPRLKGAERVRSVCAACAQRSGAKDSEQNDRVDVPPLPAEVWV